MLISHRSAVLLALSLASAAAIAQKQAAEAIYLDAHILTGVGLTSANPTYVEALAVAQGQVLATGTSAEVRAKYSGPGTRIVDLHGAFAMPGFNDAHMHLAAAGEIKLSVDLSGTRSLQEMQTRIRQAAASGPPGGWLIGGGWDNTLWANNAMPTRADIDAATAGHPALFDRVDHHLAVANTAALAAAGITAQTVDPQGARFDRDPAGEPTGLIRELRARTLVASHIPPPTPENRRKGLALALADAAAHGVTSVQDLSSWEDFHVFEQLEREGQLPVRVSEWLLFDTPLPELERMRAAHPAKDRMLHTGMLKGFMDGSLGSHTAAMLAPYADDPANLGLPRYTQAQLDAMAGERGAAGFQIGFHAIGDRAVEMALQAFAVAEQARVQGGVPGEPRFRIEHSQVLAPGQVERYKSEGVIASMQPSHLLSDMHWAPARLGPERTAYAYAWKAFLDAGVTLAFGTDYPVEPVTPFRGLYAAVTRRDETGTMSFHPEAVLTLGQAIYAYTQGSAYAEFTESWKGQLVPGAAADFVVLDRDLMRAAPAAVLHTQVLATYVGGREVYSNPAR